MLCVELINCLNLQDIHRWTKEHEKLINLSSEVDYDVDAYAQNLEELINEQVDNLLKFKERVNNFKSQLREEELMSKKLVR